MKSQITGLILAITALATAGAAIIRARAVDGATDGRATICASVVAARSAVELRGAPVFLTLGHAYAGKGLTVVALGENRSQFAEPGALVGHRICVSGHMLNFFGNPRLVLDSPAP